MNCTSATRQAAAQHILLATLDCFDDWKTGGCPVASMLDLVQSAVRMLVIAAAGVALALAGIVVSVLAYMRELCTYAARRKEGASHGERVPHPPHHPRDRDHTSPVRNPRPRRSLGREPTLTPIPASPVASTSKPTSLATPPRSPERDSPRLRQERSVSRKRDNPRKQLRLPCSPNSTASSETAVDLDRTPRPPPLGTQVPNEAPPGLHIYSDSSLAPSTDPSVASISSGEPVESPSRSVLQRIKSHHSNLRDRCLVRAQSIPNPRPPRSPRRRTDPYQAPYHFPTPMSPDAGTYLQEVINERHGRLPPTPTVNVTEQVRFASLPSSPNRAAHDLPEASPAPTVPAQPEGEAEASSRPTARRHRWSWHMPQLPERTRSVDSDRNMRRMPEKEHKDGFPKFKFGHIRRRSGNDDVRTSKPT